MNPDLPKRYADDGLRILYDAFQNKFRTGFRDAGEMIHLYERLGYKITQTNRGFWVWLATTSDAVRRMEKRLT